MAAETVELTVEEVEDLDARLEALVRRLERIDDRLLMEREDGDDGS